MNASKLQKIKTKLLNNRKLRCGSFSVLICLGVIVLAVLLTVLFDLAESRYALRQDLSFNNVTVFGAETADALDTLDKDVHIYAVIPQSGENESLLQLIDRYCARSPRVTCSRESVVKNPALLTRFKDSLGENEITADCLIVYCEKTGRARVLCEDDYYVYQYDISTGYFASAGYTYEKSLTEAILYVAKDELPTLQILTGHGELSKADLELMLDTLVSANYGYEFVNPANGNTLDPDRILMILSPVFDFSDADLEALIDFAKKGGRFLILQQYTDPVKLDNVNALLRTFGVSARPGLVIAKEEDSNSYYEDIPVCLIPYMQESEITRPLIDSGKTLLLLAGARAYAAGEERDSSLNVKALLTSGQSYIRNYLDGLDTSDKQPGDEEGVFALAVRSDKLFDDGTVSRAVIMGNTSAFTDYFTINSTNSTAFLLQTLSALQGSAPDRTDILPRNALHESLTLRSVTPAVIVTVMLPLLVVLGALLVLLPKKNK